MCIFVRIHSYVCVHVCTVRLHTQKRVFSHNLACNLSIYLSIYISVCLSVCLPVCLCLFPPQPMYGSHEVVIEVLSTYSRCTYYEAKRLSEVRKTFCCLVAFSLITYATTRALLILAPFKVDPNFHSSAAS